MLSTDCNREGADQVIPILHRAGYKEVHLAHSPGPIYAYHDEVPGWMHSDMWIVPLDAKLALIYPPSLSCGCTVSWMKSSRCCADAMRSSICCSWRRLLLRSLDDACGEGGVDGTNRHPTAAQSIGAK
jgi:hypothetical protein